MSRLNKTDLELIYSGQKIDLSDSEGRWAYLGGEFTANPEDYVEALIYTAGEEFLESSIVDPEDYKFTKGQDIKLNTGTILRKLGYDRGRFIVKYNFFRYLVFKFSLQHIFDSTHVNFFIIDRLQH